MISFSCNNCGKGFRVPGDKGGKTAKCPGCGHLLQVPIANNAPRPIDVRRPGDPPSRPSEKPSPRRRHHISPEEHARAKLAGRQRANLILLGVILLIGFLMPVIKIEGALRTRSVELANITILTQDSAPMSLKVLCLIPGVAGVGLLVLQTASKHPVRGIVIVFMAMTPIAILLTDYHIVRAMIPAAGGLQGHSSLVLLLGFMDMFAAPVAMLAGVRSRSYRPDSLSAYCFSIAGAACWFVFLVTPALPAEQGHIFLMVPIKLLKQSAVRGQAIALTALIACMSVSAIICVINGPSTKFLKARKLAEMAFWALAVGFVVLMLCLAGTLIDGFPSLVGALKLLCWFGGMFLLLPAGITDLVVGHVHHHGGQRHDDMPQAYNPDHTASGRAI
jgi:hypothetical protein